MEIVADSLNLRLMASALLAAVEAQQRENAQRVEQHQQRMDELAAITARQQALLDRQQVLLERHEDRLDRLADTTQETAQRMARAEETAQDIRQILQLLTRRFSGE